MRDALLTDIDAGSTQAYRFAEELCELDTLLTRCIGDAAFASSLVKRFDGRLVQVVNEIDRLVAESNWPDAIRRTHSLKGEAGNLAATGLHKLAAELEQRLRCGRWSEIPPTVTEMKTSCEQFRQAVPTLLELLAKSAKDDA